MHPFVAVIVEESEIDVLADFENSVSFVQMNLQLVFCLATYLHGLVLTCIDFGQAEILTQVDPTFSLFDQPAQDLYMCEIYVWNLWPFVTCVNLYTVY